jgi:hypothetical protein
MTNFNFLGSCVMHNLIYSPLETNSISGAYQLVKSVPQDSFQQLIVPLFSIK